RVDVPAGEDRPAAPVDRGLAHGSDLGLLQLQVLRLAEHLEGVLIEERGRLDWRPASRFARLPGGAGAPCVWGRASPCDLGARRRSHAAGSRLGRSLASLRRHGYLLTLIDRWLQAANAVPEGAAFRLDDVRRRPVDTG